MTRRRVDGVTVLTMAGEIDLLTVPEFAATLATCTEGPVVLDLTAVTFLDSSGINAVLRASGEVESAGHRLLVVADLADEGNAVIRPLRLCGADELLTVVASVATALARLRR
ncbi:STAS domain-containing protein [Amycolatopsis solani]|uniref:STAS domain-containing protein n=1 Tax=Amycolatopsis solani TaxID=3028615 RepID=UPI0025AFED5D|nr:STAS domain-containing protein [Amycolatopsis sp. MEP2-6]